MYCNICGKKISNNKTLCDECHKKHEDALKNDKPKTYDNSFTITKEEGKDIIVPEVVNDIKDLPSNEDTVNAKSINIDNKTLDENQNNKQEKKESVKHIFLDSIKISLIIGIFVFLFILMKYITFDNFFEFITTFFLLYFFVFVITCAVSIMFKAIKGKKILLILFSILLIIGCIYFTGGFILLALASLTIPITIIVTIILILKK